MPRRASLATTAVLSALARGGRYGLDIIAMTDLPSGTVYPILARLERDGLVKAEWERASVAHADARPRRRYYALTRRGTAALREAVAAWQEIVGTTGALESRPA